MLPSGTTPTKKRQSGPKRLRRSTASSVCLVMVWRLSVLALTDAKGQAYQVDVTDEQTVKKAVEEHVKEFNGRLDIFVANAGIPWVQGPMTDGETSHYHKVVSTDLDGVFYCAKAAAEIWRKQYETGADLAGNKLENYSYGSFVATASMSGHIANIPQLQSAVSS